MRALIHIWMAAIVCLTAAFAPAFANASENGGQTQEQCSSEHHFKTVEDGVLKVMATQLPPWSTVEGGDIGGVDGEIVKRIADMECLKLDVRNATYTSAISAVKTGRADLMTGAFYITPKRGQILGQTDPMYVDYPAFVSDDKITTIDGLDGRRVGTVQGYAWVEDLSKIVPSGKLRIYQSAVQVMNDLISGRLDVGVLGLGESFYRVQNRNTNLKVNQVKADPRLESSQSPSRVNLPHTKGNKKLTEALNDDIATLKRQEVIKNIITSAGLDPVLADIPESTGSVGQ